MQALTAPFARSADCDAVLSTMHDIDLLAVIVADEEVWRLTATHGAPTLAIVGRREEIRDRVRQLSSHPADLEQAAVLGALLLPDNFFRETSETLHVVIDDQLTELPAAALRHGDRPLIAFRPIVRELRLPETSCVPPIRPGRVTVLGDPRGTLGYARLEAEQVASLFHTQSKTGREATKQALFAAGRDAVLHVAGRTASDSDGAAIELWDGQVSALEIAARSLAPSLAVLSSCSAANSSTDGVELIGSLAAGFLAAGSQHVVATLRSVTDASALEVIEPFYEAGGVSDPARALQTAQSKLWNTRNVEWPIFTVFGPDVCLQYVPVHP
jgi:hypothetical protein